ncbi:hypothetical protein [Nonomuraea recticatena]
MKSSSCTPATPTLPIVCVACMKAPAPPETMYWITLSPTLTG